MKDKQRRDKRKNRQLFQLSIWRQHSIVGKLSPFYSLMSHQSGLSDGEKSREKDELRLKSQRKIYLTDSSPSKEHKPGFPSLPFEDSVSVSVPVCVCKRERDLFDIFFGQLSVFLDELKQFLFFQTFSPNSTLQLGIRVFEQGKWRGAYMI